MSSQGAALTFHMNNERREIKIILRFLGLRQWDVTGQQLLTLKSHIVQKRVSFVP